MKTMTDLRKKLFNACDPLAPATPEYYVDCSQVRGCNAFSRQVQNELELATSPLRFLFSGHIGSGKSSELQDLRHSLEQSTTDGKRYFPILLDAGEYLNDYDVTPSDIFLSIVVEVAATLKEKVEVELKDSYFENRINEFWKFLTREVDVEEVEVPLWEAKTKVKLLRQAPSAREEVRKKLVPQMPTILTEINTLFDEARLKLRKLKLQAGSSPFSDIVLILDNLEKIERIGNRKEGEESQRHLFIECAPQLTGLNAHVIYTVPLRLVRSHGPELKEVYGVDPFVLPMIKVEERGTHKPHHQGRACLKQILQKRAGATSLDDVFTHAALDWLLTYCGGHVRDLMHFVRQACTEVKGLPIDIKAAHRSLRGTIAVYSTAIPAAHWPKLARLERSTDQKLDNNDPDCRKMLEMVSVMEYINGGVESDPFNPAEPWYAVNPIVRQLGKFKATVEALDQEKTS
jgi:hypothetical protein